MIYSRDVALPCQVFTLINNDTGQFLLIGCGSWACDKCGPRKVARFSKCVDRIPQSYKFLKFLTITYAGPWLASREFNRRVGYFFRLLRERFGRFEFARVNERGGNTGRLHAHTIANLPFISNWRYGKRLFSELAQRAGLGWCTIKARPREVARRYLTKYMHKFRGDARERYERWHQCSMGLRGVPSKQKASGAWQVVRKVIDFERWAKATVQQWQSEMRESQARAAGCVCLDTDRCICGAAEDVWQSSPLNSSLNLKMPDTEEKLDEAWGVER